VIRYQKGDIVSFKFSAALKETYNGVIVSSYKSKLERNYIYEIASMNHSMVTYSISGRCILKKLA